MKEGRRGKERKHEVTTVVGCDASTCRQLARRHARRWVLHTRASTPASLSHTRKPVETTVYTQEGGSRFRRWRMPPMVAGVSRSTRSVNRRWQQQQQQIWE